MKWISYTEFEDARLTAGLSFFEARQLLDVSERTYLRWKHDKRVPYWAWQIMSLLSGDLSHFGWDGWELRNGKLFQIDLNARYHFWTPAEILMTTYCKCPGHAQIRTDKHGAAINDESRELANSANVGSVNVEKVKSVPYGDG